MTILEAENIYHKRVKQYQENFKNKYKKYSKIAFVFACALFIISIILLVLGYSQPEEDIFDSDLFLKKMFGVMLLPFGMGVFAFAISFIWQSKRGPKSYLPLNKELWLNYIRCEDVSQEEREYYKQKLEDIRAAELANALDGVSSAVIFTSLIK